MSTSPHTPQCDSNVMQNSGMVIFAPGLPDMSPKPNANTPERGRGTFSALPEMEERKKLEQHEVIPEE